jgi:hypothetical protein
MPPVPESFRPLLRVPPPGPKQSAAQVKRVRRRTEEARLDAWQPKPRTFLPRRLIPQRSAEAPRKKR